MSDETEARTGTVYFEYKVPNGEPYGSKVASVYLPTAVNVENDDFTRARAREAFTAAQELVYEVLGVEYEVKYSDEGVAEVVALIKEAFGPGVTVQNTDDNSAPHPGAHKVEIVGADGRPYPEWLDAAWDKAEREGKTEGPPKVWDNRKFLPQFGGNGNSKAPWFKAHRKVNGEAAAFWPPKGSN